MEPARDAVVRSFARAVARPCARPGCPAPATSTLSFRYASREAWLAELREDPTPETYDLCGSHADRTRPPHGWQLVDRRPVDAADDGPEGFGDDRTVAVLAAALRADDAVSETPPALGADVSSDGAPSRPAGPQATEREPHEDEDLAAVLSALVHELDSQGEVETVPDTADPGMDEIALLAAAVESLQDAAPPVTPEPGRPEATQDRLAIDEPGIARDW